MTGPLLAVPNVSEGRDGAALNAIGEAFEQSGNARVLDLHADADHHRAVFTLAGEPGRLAHAVLDGAREAVARIDLHKHEGIHPRVGAIDVAPIVYLDDERRGAATAEALVLGDLLGEELQIPVFLYGALGGGRTRAELRRGDPEELARTLTPDFGPRRLHPTAGATLVAARPPLIAFNLELRPPATEDDARRIAKRIREGQVPGVRALGLHLAGRNTAQVSCNVEDARPGVLAELAAAIPQAQEAELVGLAPKATFANFPPDLPIRNRRTIEDALAQAGPPPDPPR